MIDACVFVGDSLYGNSRTPDEVLGDLDRHGLDRAIARPFKPSDYNYDRANRLLGQALATRPRLSGFGRVNPLEKTAPAQVAALRGYGLLGLHLHPWEDNYEINNPKINATLEAAEAAALPVYVSTGYPCVSEPLQLWETAMRFPRLTFIATHGGQLDMSGMMFDDALEAAGRAKNIKFDLSGVYRRDFIELLIKTAGVDNVLFASCAPYMDFSLEIERVKAAQIPDAWKERLFAKNAEALLGSSLRYK